MGFECFFCDINRNNMKKNLGTWEEHEGNNVILFSLAFGQDSSLGYRQQKIEINIEFIKKHAKPNLQLENFTV